MQTLEGLHERAELAHLDVTAANVMVSNMIENDWHEVRMLDFGFSVKCTPGSNKDIICLGATQQTIVLPLALMLHSPVVCCSVLQQSRVA